MRCGGHPPFPEPCTLWRKKWFSTLSQPYLVPLSPRHCCILGVWNPGQYGTHGIHHPYAKALLVELVDFFNLTIVPIPGLSTILCPFFPPPHHWFIHSYHTHGYLCTCPACWPHHLSGFHGAPVRASSPSSLLCLEHVIAANHGPSHKTRECTGAFIGPAALVTKQQFLAHLYRKALSQALGLSLPP